MSDQAFEARLQHVLHAYADDAIRPIDAVQLAERAMSARPLTATRRTTGLHPVPWLAATLVAAALLMVLMFALTAGGRNLFSDTTPVQVPTPGPQASSMPIASSLAGTWIAEKPASVSLGDASSPARMSLVVDANGALTYVTISSSPDIEWLPALSEAAGVDEIRLTARAASSVGGGDTLRCDPGEVGTYRVTRSFDGLLLTLATIADACPSRSTVYARTWVRSLGAPSGGGLGVIDAFDPLFTVDIPDGSYSVSRSVVDAFQILQPVPEFQFLAFKDPQGFNDPCDPVGGGRREIAPGADAFVDYFRQLPGFTVDSVTEREVDGHRAVRLVVHANLDASCPNGRLAQWQPKVVTSDVHWFLRPGDTDSLWLVELADATLMFEVLPAPHELEAGVIDSIRFLERLPDAP